MASSVRGRIILGFGLLVLILIAVVAGSAWLAREHRSDLAEVERHTATASALETFTTDSAWAGANLEHYILTGDETAVREVRLAAGRALDDLTEARGQAQLGGSDEQMQRLDEILSAGFVAGTRLEEIIDLRENGDVEAATAQMEETLPWFRDFWASVGEAAAFEQQQASLLRDRADTAGALAFWLLIGSGVAGAALGLVAATLIARSILKPLSSVESVALAVADGDLEARAQPKGPRELASLGASLNRMTESLLKDRETIEHMAYFDPLTALANRTLFLDHLGLALAQARRSRRPMAVMFIDLDRFKLVNDTAGHSQGDQFLRGVAAELEQTVREGDTVARAGGDEFTLLLPEIASPADAVEVAQRVLDALRRPRSIGGHEFHITPSIGIVIHPSDDGSTAGADAETLLANADIAMYRAKAEGGNRYQIHTPAMNAGILERLSLETDLRHALDREEFVLHYQPQVSIGTGRVVGAEALVRWQHPERGLVAPMEFIPVAEETGLIVLLGDWVLRTACAQAKAWLDEGLPCTRIAVNLSARQFQQRDLVGKVAQVLKETGLGPCGLQLEITESVAIQDVDYTALVLGQFKEMGVQIGIDDFGTGNSALSYLQRFPIDAVKIDRSFVRDITANSNDAEIAAAVIDMSHRLKLDVIAEGVETDEQLDFLRQRQCDEMQGYLFSKPVPAEEFAAIVKQGRSLPVRPVPDQKPRTSSPAGR